MCSNKAGRSLVAESNGESRLAVDVAPSAEVRDAWAMCPEVRAGAWKRLCVRVRWTGKEKGDASEAISIP